MNKNWNLNFLLKPGIKIRRKKNVPLYWLDENDSNIIIRELNGKINSGTFKNGKFTSGIVAKLESAPGF